MAIIAKGIFHYGVDMEVACSAVKAKNTVFGWSIPKKQKPALSMNHERWNDESSNYAASLRIYAINPLIFISDALTLHPSSFD